ncbi:ankyrin-3-like [Gigantopelta aegis]|uniref:ankyrin-3-like n=1 Tax=Gigantopelta aegis TaxID=1735272 RepID=UPI001B88A982|nr:ankyrin-3-like [Gigantopelta aegis]
MNDQGSMVDPANDSTTVAMETPLVESEAHTDVLRDFFCALVDNDMKVITIILESKKADVNMMFDEPYDFVVPRYKGWGPIHIITKHGNIMSLKLLVRLGADVALHNKDGDTALHIASRYGSVHCVEFLLACNKSLINNVNNQGLSPLLRAVFKFEFAFKGQYNKTIQALLSVGCDTNICSSAKITALHLAASRGDASLSRLLLNGGANVNAVCCQGSTPLLKALYAMRVNVQCVKVLLDAGADVEVQTISGRSVLHLAIIKCDEACVESILLAGANPNVQDNYGKTPLWISVQENNVRLVPIIVKYGGDVNYCRPPQNLSLLSLAITCQSVSMVEQLIRLGASVDTETALCATPLSLAVDVQNIPIIKLLLHENCRLNIVGNSNHTLIPQTPLQIAFERANLNVIKLLMKAGCKVEASWLKPRNLSASLLQNQCVLHWIEDYCRTVQPLLHMCRVTVRNTIGPGIKDKLENLCAEAVIPRRLADYLMLTDLLADDKISNNQLHLGRGNRLNDS